MASPLPWRRSREIGAATDRSLTTQTVQLLDIAVYMLANAAVILNCLAFPLELAFSHKRLCFSTSPEWTSLLLWADIVLWADLVRRCLHLRREPVSISGNESPDSTPK